MVKMKLQLTKFQVMGLFVLHDKYSTNIEKFIISSIKQGLYTLDNMENSKEIVLLAKRKWQIAPFDIGNITLVIPKHIRDLASQKAKELGVKMNDLLRAFISGNIANFNDIDIMSSAQMYMR